MYGCRPLANDEIKEVYDKYLKQDFPKSERKPLFKILCSLKKERYICYGIFKEELLFGYAYFVLLKENGKSCYLLDYFATIKGMRGNGIGSAFLKLLRDEIRDGEMLLCEAESPVGSTGDELAVREDRITFYLKNGFTNTGVTANTFGVDYIILELAPKKPHTKDDVIACYHKLYNGCLPKFVCNKFIKTAAK